MLYNMYIIYIYIRLTNATNVSKGFKHMFDMSVFFPVYTQ